MLRSYRYIYSDNGVVAMYLTTRTGRDTIIWEEMEELGGFEGKGTFYTDSLYYIHTDHLDSYYANPNLQNWFQEVENARGRPCRQAMRTRWCGGISADLTFLVLFWSSKKVQEENMKLPNKQAQKKVYLLCRAKESWAKPTYGQLYGPVIGRFFSPDNYVANSN